MAALDRRRSVSLRASTYRAILADCQRREQSLSDYVEAPILADLQRRGLMGALAEEIARSHQITAANRQAREPGPTVQPPRAVSATSRAPVRPSASVPTPASTSHPAPPSNTPATQAKQPGSLPRAKDAGSSKPAAERPLTVPPPAPPPAEGSLVSEHRRLTGTAPGPAWGYNRFPRALPPSSRARKAPPPIPDGRDGESTRAPAKVQRMVPRNLPDPWGIR